MSPRAAFSDSLIVLHLRGVLSGGLVTVRASAVDASHGVWTGHATYRVPSTGVLTLAAPALSGNYTGVDEMGLLLTMAPRSVERSGPVFISPSRGYAVDLVVLSHGRVIASTSIWRRNQLSSLHDTVLRPASDGVYGDLFMPKNLVGRHPGVLVFGGSEGGESGGEYAGSLIATHGYPVLALAYFGEPGLPSGLRNIPLGYFLKALAILRSQPEVDPRHVLVYGISRGGELALLLASLFPSQVNGVIAGVPSSNVNSASGSPPGAAWTLHGKPVPEGPIAVQNIRGPILQACGEMDLVWPSCSYVARIHARLEEHHFRYGVTTLRFPDAGHAAGSLTCCTPELAFNGGTINGNALAQVAGHRAVLRFLRSQA